LLNGFFATEALAGRITAHEWVANDINALSPFDFWLHPAGSSKVKVEVKSTTGDHKQVMHFSTSELLEIIESSEPYHIYRLSKLDDHAASLRIATNPKDFAKGIITVINGLPAGVTVDSVSIRPDSITFGAETKIELAEDDEEIEDEAG
jgi:hypothetical protein